jgi:hypothetical protein
MDDACQSPAETGAFKTGPVEAFSAKARPSTDFLQRL